MFFFFKKIFAFDKGCECQMFCGKTGKYIKSCMKIVKHTHSHSAGVSPPRRGPLSKACSSSFFPISFQTLYLLPSTPYNSRESFDPSSSLGFCLFAARLYLVWVWGLPYLPLCLRFSFSVGHVGDVRVFEWMNQNAFYSWPDLGLVLCQHGAPQ